MSEEKHRSRATASETKCSVVVIISARELVIQALVESEIFFLQKLNFVLAGKHHFLQWAQDQ